MNDQGIDKDAMLVLESEPGVRGQSPCYELLL